jgi:hypothetical protein
LDSKIRDWVCGDSARYGKESPEDLIPNLEDDMTTPRMRALVSLGAAMTIAATLSLTACAPTPAQLATNAPTPAESSAPLSIRFDNGERERVQVYLIGERREWLLGRVEPGAVAQLKVPDAWRASTSGVVQLAVVRGERSTMQVARDSRAMLSVAQPMSALTTQRWRVAQGQLSPRS